MNLPGGRLSRRLAAGSAEANSEVLTPSALMYAHDLLDMVPMNCTDKNVDLNWV